MYLDSILKELYSLRNLHLISKDFNHIIEYQPGSWKTFEPTKFVYSFFTFNTFYNYDWFKSIESNELVTFKSKVESNSNLMQKLEDSELYSYTRKSGGPETFIGDAIKIFYINEFVSDFIDPIDYEIIFKELISAFSEGNFDHLDHSRIKKEIKNRMQKIVVDEKNSITKSRNITEKLKDQFINNIDMILQNEKADKKSLYQILIFVYKVRCNIFHGTKDTLLMSDPLQRKRIEIYSSIVIGFNEMLFKVLSNRYNCSFTNKYQLNLR